MVDNKSKTKTAMLQELESIKGLLKEEDEIPILQEVVEEEDLYFQVINVKTTPSDQAPLSRQDLNELKTQFQALGETIAASAPLKPEPTSTSSEAGKPPDSASLLDAFTRASIQQAKLHKGAIGQQSLFNEVQEPRNRPTLAKGSGENPFLPQHIRARLQGSNPPSLFEQTISKTPVTPVNKVTGNKGENDSLTRQRLIREVIAAVIPKLEEELRERLENLSERELEDLRDHG